MIHFTQQKTSQTLPSGKQTTRGLVNFCKQTVSCLRILRWDYDVACPWRNESTSKQVTETRWKLIYQTCTGCFSAIVGYLLLTFQLGSKTSHIQLVLRVVVANIWLLLGLKLMEIGSNLFSRKYLFNHHVSSRISGCCTIFELSAGETNPFFHSCCFHTCFSFNPKNSGDEFPCPFPSYWVSNIQDCSSQQVEAEKHKSQEVQIVVDVSRIFPKTWSHRDNPKPSNGYSWI